MAAPLLTQGGDGYLELLAVGVKVGDVACSWVCADVEKDGVEALFEKDVSKVRGHESCDGRLQALSGQVEPVRK